MEAMKTLSLIAVAALGAVEVSAFAASHETRSQLRPYMAGNLYLGQQIQGSLTQFRLTDDSQEESLRMAGLALKTLAGVEHLRCLQTGIFYVNLNVHNGARELLGHEFGAEAKLSLNSPLVNVAVGGGGFFSSSRFRNEADVVSLAGTGGFGVIELTYYVSERTSLTLSGSQVVTEYRKNDLDDQKLRANGNSTRLGAGLSIWL